MEPDDEGVLTCNVCGHFWDDHTIGGNCIYPPMVNYWEDGKWVMRPESGGAMEVGALISEGRRNREHARTQSAA